MNKKLVRNIHIIGGIIFALLLGLILWYSGFDYEGASHDEKNFKSSYEALNLKKDSDGIEYKQVKLSKDNKMVSIDVDDAIKRLKNGTSLIFMGSPTDHTSRAYVETIVESVSEFKVDKIYYLEISYEDELNYSKLVKAFGEESLILPRIDAIKDGKVIGTIEDVGLEDGQDISKGLNEEQKKTLKSAIKVLVDDLNKNDKVCNEGC